MAEKGCPYLYFEHDLVTQWVGALPHLEVGALGA